MGAFVRLCRRMGRVRDARRGVPSGRWSAGDDTGRSHRRGRDDRHRLELPQDGLGLSRARWRVPLRARGVRRGLWIPHGLVPLARVHGDPLGERYCARAARPLYVRRRPAVRLARHARRIRHLPRRGPALGCRHGGRRPGVPLRPPARRPRAGRVRGVHARRRGGHLLRRAFAA